MPKTIMDFNALAVNTAKALQTSLQDPLTAIAQANNDFAVMQRSLATSRNTVIERVYKSRFWPTAKFVSVENYTLMDSSIIYYVQVMATTDPSLLKDADSKDIPVKAEDVTVKEYRFYTLEKKDAIIEETESVQEETVTFALVGLKAKCYRAYFINTLQRYDITTGSQTVSVPLSSIAPAEHLGIKELEYAVDLSMQNGKAVMVGQTSTMSSGAIKYGC